MLFGAHVRWGNFREADTWLQMNTWLEWRLDYGRTLKEGRLDYKGLTALDYKGLTAYKCLTRVKTRLQVNTWLKWRLDYRWTLDSSEGLKTAWLQAWLWSKHLTCVRLDYKMKTRLQSEHFTWLKSEDRVKCSLRSYESSLTRWFIWVVELEERSPFGPFRKAIPTVYSRRGFSPNWVGFLTLLLLTTTDWLTVCHIPLSL